MGFPAPAAHPKQTKENPPAGWDVVLVLARRQLHRFVSLEPRVLQGSDPDAIHDFRVASRRLQQVLDLLYAKPRSKKIRKMRRVIQRSRRVLSTVRNCDVLMQRVDHSLTRKRTGHRETWLTFRDYLEKLRSECFREAAGRLGRLNLSDFYVRLQDLWNLPPQPSADLQGAATEGSQPLQEAEMAAFEDRVIRELRVIWEAFDAQVAKSRQEQMPKSFHAVRIAAKRLRYLVEVIGELGAPGTKQVLARLRRLQQRLGDWHDREVVEQMMAEMLARPGFLRSNLDFAIQIERLMQKNQKSKRLYEEKYFETGMDWAGASEQKAWVLNFITKSPRVVLET